MSPKVNNSGKNSGNINSMIPVDNLNVDLNKI